MFWHTLAVKFDLQRYRTIRLTDFVTLVSPDASNFHALIIVQRDTGYLTINRVVTFIAFMLRTTTITTIEALGKEQL